MSSDSESYLDYNPGVKEEPKEIAEEPKEEDTKEEPTAVPVHEEEENAPVSVPLALGQIPSNMIEPDQRWNELDYLVRNQTRGHGIPEDIDDLTVQGKEFVEGNITGLFTVHLQRAAFWEAKAAKKRASRRASRQRKKLRRSYSQSEARPSGHNE